MDAEGLLALPRADELAAALAAVPDAEWPALRRRLLAELTRPLPDEPGDDPAQAYRTDLARLELEWRRREQRDLIAAEHARRGAPT